MVPYHPPASIRAILVPLDGSALAETALDVAIPIARRMKAMVETVTVYESQLPWARLSGAPVPDTRFDAEMRAASQDYVEHSAIRLESLASGLTTRAVFRAGPVAREIATQVSAGHHDLVVMTTHGRSGPSLHWLGSVADRLIRRCTVPILLLPDGHGGAEFPDVIVPLDGARENEGVMDMATTLAGSAATYHLFHVAIPRPFPLPPSIDVLSLQTGGRFPPDLPGALRDAGLRYLDTVAARWRAAGLDVTTEARVHTSAAAAILDYAAELNASLIAMASRGPRAARQLLLGGVSDKVIRGAKAAVLIRAPVLRRRARVTARARQRAAEVLVT
jgi:nucleotide-binding universal stress UspA family protein